MGQNNSNTSMVKTQTDPNERRHLANHDAAHQSNSGSQANGEFNESTDSPASIRVPVIVLDNLMNLMGEMVLVRNQVLQYANRGDNLQFLNLSQRLDVVTSEIQGEVMKTRMQPIGNILAKLHRVTRDIAKELNKKIDLVLFGVETELDKTLLETVKDPILQIVRGFCEHGIENLQERNRLGKVAIGTITIRAYQESGQVIVELSHDGSNPGPESQSAIEFEKKKIEGIGGMTEVHGLPGDGTTIRMKIPITLAIVPAMIVRSGSERFAIPQVKLLELVRVESSASQTIENIQGMPVLRLRGHLLPLVNLREVLQIQSGSDDSAGVINIAVLNADGSLFGLVVDEVQDTAEVVVKPLCHFLKSPQVYCGATVLGDGSVALILDIIGLAQRLNLNTDENRNSQNRSSQLERSAGKEQEYLLFKINSPSRHAMPLSLVQRLEEFKASEIEFSGQQRFVRYRRSALPIISLNRFLDFPEATACDVVSVIVIQKSSRLYGIEVNEIYDVLKTETPLDEGLSDRPGIFGNLVMSDELIVVVDMMKILDEVTKILGVA